MNNINMGAYWFRRG